MTADIITLVKEGLPVIISLIIIEGLLSVDNILAIATLAAQLPVKQKKTALRTGLAGAYVFRGVALYFVGFIMENMWVKFLGSFYLIHLMAEHFSNYAAVHDDDPTTNPTKARGFWPTVFAIQLMDLSLSVDNVVTAVAMSEDIRVVVIGVCLGLLTLWMFASLSLRLVERYPILQHAAFLLIGYVGLILLVEMSADYLFHVDLHITPLQKFIGVVIIMALSIQFSRSERFARFCAPFVRIGTLPVIAYAKVSCAVIGAILWPFKQALAVFRKSVPEENKA
jgi:YkoY family integral membrane protein